MAKQRTNMAAKPVSMADTKHENQQKLATLAYEFWDIDLRTFGMEIVLNRRLAAGSLKRFEFAEQEPQQPFAVEPGLERFLKDTSLSGDATEEEIEFLKALKFRGKEPSPIYYYRALQNLRDPLHFPPVAQPGESD